MPRFAANLSLLFTEYPLLDRFAACREAGFRFVEHLYPYDHDPDTLAALLKKHSLTQVHLNLPPGDRDAGEKGIASHPDRIDEFRRSVALALEYARILGVPRLHCMSGLRLDGIPYDEQKSVLIENLRYASLQLAAEDRLLLIEPLNSYDIPGYFFSTSREGLDLLHEVGTPNIRLQYDVYHMQKMEGNLIETIRLNLAAIGHIQIADNPGRHQPGTGEINYRILLRQLDEMGYEGFVGLEYTPVPDTRTSLSWVEEMGFSL